MVNDKYSFSLNDETLQVYQKKTGKVLQDPTEIVHALEKAYKTIESSIFPEIRRELATAVEHVTQATKKK